MGRFFWLVGILWGLAGPAQAARGEVHDYATLMRRLPRKTGPRVERLRAFAADQRLRISDRIRAGRELLRLLDEDDPARVQVLLDQAVLFGVAHSRRERTRALFAAEERAAQHRDPVTAQAARTVRETDERLRTLSEMMESRLRRDDDTALTPDEAALQVAIQRGAAAYDRIGDVYGATGLRIALARLKEATGATLPDVLAAYTRLLRAGGNGRDTAHLRQEVRRARARVLEHMGERKEAVHESLIADRMVVVPATRPAFDKVERTIYDKSRHTEQLCHRVRLFGVHCDEVQQQEMDNVVYYDYTRDPARTTLGPDVLDRTYDEYGGLLQACVTEQKSAGGEAVRIEWQVTAQGRVDHVVVRPAALQHGPLGRCARDALAIFRYPRSQEGGSHVHRVLSPQ